MAAQRDSLYLRPINTLTAFRFDEHVAEIFDDMVRRSIPGYQTVIEATGLLTQRFAQDNSQCYDLGCSTGAATLVMATNIKKSKCSIIAVDNSEAMIGRCQEVLNSLDLSVPVKVLCADILDVDIRKASVVVLNYTLQFIPPDKRLQFLSKIYEGLLFGGALILSEKLCFDDPRQQDLQQSMYYDFKKDQGYSELEISQKRTALEDVLIPDTLTQHRNRLNKAGFNSVEVWFQYFNFASIIALK